MTVIRGNVSAAVLEIDVETCQPLGSALSRSTEQTLNIRCCQGDWGCLSFPHGYGPGRSLVGGGTHRHTCQALRGSWRCSRNAVLSGCRRETCQCRARPAAGRTPGSTGSRPAPMGLLRGTGGQDLGRGRACHTGGKTPAGTAHGKQVWGFHL